MSDFLFPDANALFNHRCRNYAGKVRMREPSYRGTISHVIAQVQQVFHRVVVPSAEAAEDARFEYFVLKILKPLRASGAGDHTAIFLPNYLDFARLRKYLRENDIAFAGVSECVPQWPRAAGKNGGKGVRLMTGNARTESRARCHALHGEGEGAPGTPRRPRCRAPARVSSTATRA